MDKDSLNKVNRLEELAKLFADDKVSYGTYIAAAYPAMILEMIAEMRNLEKEADWLVDELIMSESKKCPICDCPQKAPDIPTEADSVIFWNGCRKCWRDAARKALEQEK